MDTTRSSSPCMRVVAAALSATLAAAGLGLTVPTAFAEETTQVEGAEGAGEQPQTVEETPTIASPYAGSMLTGEQVSADEALAAQVQDASLMRVTLNLNNEALAAADLYDAVDALRASNGVGAATRDTALEQAAYQRAAESTLLAANVRPDGSLYSTASDGRATAEILVQAPATASQDADALLAALTGDQLAQLQAATNVGIALVTDAEGAQWWAIELASDGAVNNDALVAPADGAATYRVNVAAANVVNISSGGDLPVVAGTPAAAPMTATVSGSIAFGNSAAAFKDTVVNLDPTAFTWNTSDATVATVDVNGTVSGVGNGSCTVSAADSANNQFIYSVTVSGGQPAASVTDLANCTVAGILGTYEATGEAIAPAFTVIDENNGSVDEGQYSYTFENNVEPGTATLTITANPESTHLTGQLVKTFEIVAATPVQVAVPATAWLSMEDASNTVTASGLVANLVMGEAAPDTESIELVYASDPAEGTLVDGGTTVTLYYYAATGDDSADGQSEGGDDAPAPETTDLSGATVNAAPATYTGEAVGTTVTVTVASADGTVSQLTEGVDYSVAYENNVGPTTPEAPATAIVTGIGAYSGTASASFQITEAAPTTTDLAQAGYSIAPVETQAYDGNNPVTPAVSLSGGATALAQDQDYTVAYADNILPGTATVTVTGIGAYSGTLTATFTVQATLTADNTQVSGLSDLYVYSGAALTPTPTVMFGNLVLEAGKDYDVSYANNVNAGTATVTIAGKGAYAGTLTPTFTIEARSVKNAQISPIAEVTYTGGTIQPTFTVTDGTTVLTAGKDYTVAYEQNVNAGTAHVVVTGTGNYRDSIDSTFKINPVNMDRTTIVMPNMAYTGGALTPKPVSVTVGGITLVEGQDFDIVGYADNTNVGNARVTLQGKGNFTGTVTANWKIVQQGTSDAGTTQTLPKTGDATNVVAIAAGAVVGAALVVAAAAFIIHRVRANKRGR